MFSIFAKKKAPTIDDLTKAYGESKLRVAELQDQISTIKADAVRSGKIDLDALQAQIDKIELEISLHDSAMSEIRSQLETMIEAQLLDAQGEIAGRRAELQSEMLQFAADAGEQLGEAVESLIALGQPYAAKLAGQIRELVQDVLKFEKSRPGCTQFLDGFTSVEPVARSFKRELSELRPPNSDPAAMGRKVKSTVSKLLGEFRPAPQGGPGYLGTSSYYTRSPLPEHQSSQE